jgi:NADH-quinone oxidoreductase subunit J
MINTILVLFTIRIEFFSILILIVYIGAIAILFLFVIMLLDLREENEMLDKNKFFRYLIISICIAFFDSYIRSNVLEIKIFSMDLFESSETTNLPDIFNIVFNLYTYELIPLLILSIMLLVTMIGSIAFLISLR